MSLSPTTGCTPIWHTALSTGLRRSELAGLQWDSVDLDAATVEVRATLVVADGKNLHLDATKTASSRRTITLDPRTVSSLKRWRRTQSEERLAGGAGYEVTGFVFTDDFGDPLKPAWISTHWTRLVKRSELPRLTFHCARHTHASILLSSGVAVHIVSQRLGHSDVLTTLQTYAHAMPSEDGRASDAWGQAMGG